MTPEEDREDRSRGIGAAAPHAAVA